MPTADAILRIANIAIVLGVAWKVIRVCNRILDVLKDFPPHRHINGSIIYPDGFTPTRVGTILGQQR